jgi:hypothetical protein
MIPLIRLETTFCRPKPRPRPTAPENTASAVKSMPTPCSATRNATVSRVIFKSLPRSTWTEGVRSLQSLMCRSRKPDSARAPHSRTAREITPSITSKAEMRSSPSLMARESSSATVGSSSSVMLRAATVQTMTAMALLITALRIREVVARITTQAVARLRAIPRR